MLFYYSSSPGAPYSVQQEQADRVREEQETESQVQREQHNNEKYFSGIDVCDSPGFKARLHNVYITLSFSSNVYLVICMSPSFCLFLRLPLNPIIASSISLLEPNMYT